MFGEYINALGLIFAAEMGDKTQILAMMFATRYKTGKVLLGIFIGSLLNHGLAVAFGALLGSVLPVSILQVTAGIAFIGFAMWTLMDMGGEGEDEDEQKAGKGKSAVVVVAMAFFIGELGDKTQLTAITLSLDALYPAVVLMGTVSGMVLTSLLGIFVGSKIGDRIPEALIKIISSGLFLGFGVSKLVHSAPKSMINPITLTVFGIAVVLGVAGIIYRTVSAYSAGVLTPYKRAARALYDHSHQIGLTFESLCRGESFCGSCDKEKCAVGFILHLTKEIQKNDYHHDHRKMIEEIRYHKNKFSMEQMIAAKKINEAYLKEHDRNSTGYEEVAMMQQVLDAMMEPSTEK